MQSQTEPALIWQNRMAHSYSLFTNEGGGGDCACGFSGEVSSLHTTPSADTAEASILLDKDYFLYGASPIWAEKLGKGRVALCNPISGEMVVLNSTAMMIYERLREKTTFYALTRQLSGISSEVLHAVIEKLLQLKIIYAQDQCPALYQWHTPEQLSVWFHITNRCNLACSYCYVQRNKVSMSLAIGKKAIDACIRSAKTHGMKAISTRYSGGEAALVFPRVLEIHEILAKESYRNGLDCSASLLSNGTSLTKKMMQKLKENHIRLMLSLDGLNEFQDIQRPYANGRSSFQSIQDTLDALCSYEIYPQITVTVTSHSLKGLPETIDFLLERKLPFHINFYRATPSADPTLQYTQQDIVLAAKEAYAIIEKNLPRESLLASLLDRTNLLAPHQFSCGVGRNYLVILPNGQITKCQMDLANPVTSVDSEDPLADAMGSEYGIQNIPVDEKLECSSCQWRYWCAGGCPLIAKYQNGGYAAPSPNCEIYKLLFPEVLRLEALRLLKYEEPWCVQHQQITC